MWLLVIGRLLVWFPWPACQSALGLDSKPQTAPDVLVSTLHGSHHHQCMDVWITVSLFRKKHLLNALKCRVTSYNDLPYLSLRHFSTWIGKFFLIENAAPLLLLVKDVKKTGSKPPVAVLKCSSSLRCASCNSAMSTFSFPDVLQAITDYTENVWAPRCVVMSVSIMFQVAS